MKTSQFALFAAVSALSAAARAQSIVHTFHGVTASGYGGSSVDGLGDVNGDGYDDVISGMPFDDTLGYGSGRARVYSGQTGAVLFDLVADSQGDAFGTSVAGVGDVDNDGRPDFAVGASSALHLGARPGMARVYSGRTGAILHTWYGDSHGDGFGRSVAGGFDANLDGHADVVVGAPYDDNNAKVDSGSLRAFSGINGTTFTTFNGANAGDHFGTSAAIPGDVNGDGSLDFVVGAPDALLGGTRPGAAYVLHGTAGSVLWSLWGDQDNEDFGASVSGGIDVEDDNTADLVIGAPLDDHNGNDAGSVSVFNGLDGQKYNSFYGTSVNDRLGTSVACLGDVDNDGHAEFVCGASPVNVSAPGYVQVRSSWTGYVVYTLFGDAGFDRFGCAIANARDVNNDGVDDLIVGAFGAENGALLDAGLARVHSGKWLLPVIYCTAKTNSQGCVPSIYTAGASGSPSYANPNVGFAVMADSVINQRLGVLIYGMQRAATPFLGGTLCVQAPVTRTPVTSSGGSSIGTDCTGTLAIDFNDVIQSYTDSRLVPGRTVCVQWWYRDGQSIGGGGLSNAASFAIAP